ncbi:MAG TPA: LysR family transcriptional regulator, partial [Rhodospirillales bacterium]
MLYTRLRSFHAVAREGGFTAAATALGIGQPTVTSQVKALEDHFQVELFHRQGRRVRLTDTGKALFTVTQRLMAAEVEAQDMLNAVGGFHSGE